MQRYYHLVMRLLNCFDEYGLKHVRRDNNDQVDITSKLACYKKPCQHRTIIQDTLFIPSIERYDIFANQVDQDTWMSPIWIYLVYETLPKGKHEDKKMKLKLAYYVIVDGEIFRRGI